MYKFLLILLLLLSNINSSNIDDFYPPEKYRNSAHVVLSCISMVGMYEFLHLMYPTSSHSKKLFSSIGFTMVLGLGKEMIDEYTNGSFDVNDIGHDFIGTMFGLNILVFYRF